MVAWKGIVVLVVAADRCREALREFHRSLHSSRQDRSGAIQDHWEFGLCQHLGSCLGRGSSTGRTLQLHACGERHVHHLCPEVSRDVDLRRGRAVVGLLDDPVQDFTDARRIADLLLVADGVLEHRHLLHFLEAALANGLVGGLGGHQQKWSVVPVGRLHRRHEVGDAGAVLRDHHRHLPCRSGVSVRHHACIALMGAIPELDPCGWEKIRDGHHRRADDAEGILDPMHLQGLHKSFLGGHSHRRLPLAV
mmetsp:Transcript_105534/g.251447  ORF Transcript_105534/g.251447 Transcript_105534/m.251447 type:complete len:250 (+) Transcript_105534:1111-1860(+)